MLDSTRRKSRLRAWGAAVLALALVGGCGDGKDERSAPSFAVGEATREAPRNGKEKRSSKRHKRHQRTAGQDEIVGFVKRLEVADNVLAPPSATVHAVLPYMLARKDSIKGKRVLDIGCGSGVIGLFAAELGAAAVVATDIDPTAIENTRRNIERLGRKGVVEARLVPSDKPGAYSVIRADERFDLIVSNPPWFIDVDGKSNDAYSETGVLGPSIIRGLDAHLTPDGSAALIYRSDFLYPTFLARLAESLGFEVNLHPTDRIHPSQLAILYNAYLPKMFEKMGIPKEEQARYQMKTSDPWADVVINVRGKKDRKEDPYPGMVEIRKRR